MRKSLNLKAAPRFPSILLAVALLLLVVAGADAQSFQIFLRNGDRLTGTVLAEDASQVTLTNAMMQSVMDYTPYEGTEVTGWPVATVLRGQVAMRDGVVQAVPGQGRFLARGPYEMIRPRGVLPDGFDASAFA